MSQEPETLMLDGPAPGHARLSPSGAERWLACPASIGMAARVPRPPESPYAAEGTAAHALAELMARHQILGMGYDEFTVALSEWNSEHGITSEVYEEMLPHCQAYVDLIQEKLAEIPNSVLLLEQKMPCGIPESWGTSDTVIVSPVHLEIIDLKYGAGVRVDAQKNPQTRLYGLGALDTFGELLGDVRDVTMTIFQPRLEHVSSETITADELRAWRTSILPIAEEALSDNASFGPSDEACRWCPATGRCKAQLEAATAQDFGVDVDVLTPEDLAEALQQVPFIRQWLSAIEAVALSTVYAEGGTIPGFKVVQSGGKRYINDSESAIEALGMLGYTREQVADFSIKGIGKLEKLLGKKEFATLMEPYISKSEGRPSLVPEDDKRPGVSPSSEAVKEFEDA